MIVEMVCFCSAMPGVLASKTQIDGGDSNSWWMESSGSFLLICLAAIARKLVLARTISWSIYTWLLQSGGLSIVRVTGQLWAPRKKVAASKEKLHDL